MAKVFIAEDDAQVLAALTSVVKGAGHVVMGFADGKLAWEAFEREKPHAVIADVLIPSIAGSGLSHRVKKASPHVGVVLISGVYTDPAFKADAINKYKADAFLLKPVTPAQLLEVLNPLLSRAAATQPDEPSAELVLGENTNPGIAAPKAAAPAPAAAARPATGAAPAAATARPATGAAPAAGKSRAELAEEAARAAAAVRAAMAAAGIGKGAAPNPANADPAPAPAAAPAPAPAPVDTAPGLSFAAEGSLERTSVLGLLFRASNEKATGKFFFKRDVASKEIWVKDGKISHTLSNLETDKIEFKLKKEGKLSEEQYKDIGTLAKAMGGVEGALMQLKIVSGAEIFELSKTVATSLVLEIFTWLAGRFQFVPGAPPPAGAFAVDLPVDDLIQRGLKEAYDLERIQKFLGNRLKSPAEKDLVGFQSLEKLKLTPAEFRLSRMIDGKKTVDAIAKEWAAGDAAKEMRAVQILFLMEEAGMVRLSEYVEPRAAGSTGPAPAAKPTVNLEELKKILTEFEKKTLFEVLGVSKTATPGDAKKAYFALAKKYHPDTIPTDASPEHRKLIEQIFAIIGRANSVLEDPKQREQYLMELETGGDGANMEAESLLNAELEFQKGEFFLLKKKDAAQAEKHLAVALKLNPKEGEHHILWGWLLFLKTKGGAAAEAEKYIVNGLKMRDNNVAVGYLFLGHIAKAKNDIAKAEKFYQKCISIDDKNAEAMSELRVIAMRKGKK